MLASNVPSIIAKELNVRPKQVEAVIELLDDGNTVPFISRYRKEATGELDEEQIRTIEERVGYLRNLVKRQEEILSRIEEQGKLTPELKASIEASSKLQELEDLYLPYKQKKRTRAQIARERGLEPLANAILLQTETKGTPEEFASKYINEENNIATAEDALSGARDIVAETVSEDPKFRQRLRDKLWNTAHLVTSLIEDAEEKDTFLMYAEYSEPVKTLPSHRILAINRGEKKNCLKVHLEADNEALIESIYKSKHHGNSIFDQELHLAIEDGYKRLLFPSLERDIRSSLTETAEAQAISSFIWQ